MVTIMRNGQAQATPRSVTKARSNGLPFATSGPDDTTCVNGLIYGDTGVGKTFLLGTALECPEMTPALLIDIDGGSLTLKGLDIKIARPQNWKEFQEIYHYLHFDNHQFRAVFLDTLTETQRRHSMGTLLGEIDQQKDGYYRDLSSTPVDNRQDWLKSSGQVVKVIQALRGIAYLPDPERRVHVIFTAHEKLDEKRQVVSPELPGALGVQCGRWVDLLMRLSVHDVEDEETGEVREVRHLLTSQYTNENNYRYLAKNRGGRLGRSLWDPTMSKLATAWRGDDHIL